MSEAGCVTGTDNQDLGSLVVGVVGVLFGWGPSDYLAGDHKNRWSPATTCRVPQGGSETPTSDEDVWVTT